MAAQGAFVTPALGFVVEHGGKVAGERGTACLLDSALLEEEIEQRCARFIHDTLSPPAFLADHHVEHCRLVPTVDLDHEKADLSAALLLENSDEVAIEAVIGCDVVGEIVTAEIAHGSVERAHDFGILGPCAPAVRRIARLKAAQPEAVGL